MTSVVFFCDAQSQVDVDKLFHANPPSFAPNRSPPNAQRPQQVQSNPQNIDATNPVITELFDDELKPYRGSRHDEFDWALTKVFNTIYLIRHMNDVLNF